MNHVEEISELKLDFNKLTSATQMCSNILPVTVQNINSGEVILLAYTNELAFRKCFKERTLILWSTSRNELWEKGKTSGNTFDLIEAYVNCEQNSLLYKVRPRNGGICHTRNKDGRPRDCYYRRINLDTFQLENTDL